MAFKWRWPFYSSSDSSAQTGHERQGWGNPYNWHEWYRDQRDGQYGVTVSDQTAIGFSTIYACLNRLSSSIAPLPKHIMEHTDLGSVKATSHPVYPILKKRANPYMSSHAFWKKMTWDHWQYGEAFAKIVRDPRTGMPQEYYVWHKYDVEMKDINGVRMVKNHKTKEALPYDDVLHFVDHYIECDDRGRSRAMVAADLVATALSQMRFSRKFYENGTFLGGYLSFAMPLKPEQMKQNIDAWESNYGGVGAAGRTGGIDSGGKYERLNMDNTDAQHNESLVNLQKQVAAVFGMPPHKVGIHDNATFSNIAEQNIEYATDVIHPVVHNFQEEHDYKCLMMSSTDERYYTHFDLKGMLKGNPEQRAQLYKFYMEYGLLTGDDILELEDMKPKGNGMQTVQINRIPIDRMNDYADAIINGKTKNNNESGQQ